MECLNQVIRQKAINPMKVINGLIEQYPSYELAQVKVIHPEDEGYTFRYL